MNREARTKSQMKVVKLAKHWLHHEFHFFISFWNRPVKSHHWNWVFVVVIEHCLDHFSERFCAVIVTCCIVQKLEQKRPLGVTRDEKSLFDQLKKRVMIVVEDRMDETVAKPFESRGVAVHRFDESFSGIRWRVFKRFQQSFLEAHCKKNDFSDHDFLVSSQKKKFLGSFDAFILLATLGLSAIGTEDTLSHKSNWL